MPTNAANPVTPASANFEKLKAKLRELFELDKADLDFGIYRILRQRHREITEFLDKHLETTVRAALQSHGTLHQAQVAEDLRKTEQAAKEAGIAPEQSPRVMEIREKLGAGTDLDALADEVYSHLYTFFSRYYQEGDFLGLQRSTVHGREKYMIPYNGEEVKLVWANMDQYYIKSSELLRDYAFHVTPGEGTPLQAAANERYTVQFKLVQADTEKDNRKPAGKTARAFALNDESPFVEDAPDTLTIRFRYREHAAERNLQDKLNGDAEKTLADNLPAKWKELLFVVDPTYQGKDRKDIRTILQKHLKSYTAKHQFDYFIHKDLGSFLRRELDFYIKNEVLYLDDIEDTSAPKAEEYLSKIRALRRCALPVISMLEQLENFQKKLWLKKKFVVETRYCLTLDRVPEKLYPEIVANTAQREEWIKLCAIDEIKADLAQPGYSEPLTVEFLEANPYLMIDTRHFSPEFTLKLLAAIENLDVMLDGVCFHSENFQALQLMQERYRDQVKCVYIDPPYNTGNDGFAYKDNYQHSSWATMLSDRVVAQMPLTDLSCIFFASTDDNEGSIMRLCLDRLLSRDAFEAQIIVQSNKRGQTYKSISKTHEYLLTYALGASAQLGELTKAEGASAGEDRLGKYELWELRNRNPKFGRFNRSNLYYPLYVLRSRANESGFAEVSLDRRSADDIEIFPRNSKGEDSCWRWGKDTLQSVLSSLGTSGVVAKRKRDDAWGIYEKARKETTKPKSIWTETEFINEQGTIQVGQLGFKDFGFPKPVKLIEHCIALGCTNKGVILDYFTGSGTTGHAVINLNREDSGKRKYLLVEMGQYFDTVLVPRLKKVVHSTDWKDGKPQNRNSGISHGLKIVRLEGYEDALNNLRLKRTPEQEAALNNAPEKARDQYLLGYFLDVESAGSASLLDLDQFCDPFSYSLKIATASAAETKETTIDLVETFNWLLGLKVRHIDARKGFLTVIGEKRAGSRTLVIWRTLGSDPLVDNAVLEKFLGKIGVKPEDTEFDYIYVNGSHTLTDPHNKVHLIEEAFQRLMFDTPDFGMEA